MRLRLSMAILIAALPLVVFAVSMIVVVGRQQQLAVEDLLRQATNAAVRTVEERAAITRSALETLTTSMAFEPGALERGDRAALAGQAGRAMHQRPDWIALELRSRDGDRWLFARTGEMGAGETGADQTDGGGVATGGAADVPEAAAVEADVEAAFRYGEPRVSGVLVDPDGRREPAVAVSIPVFGAGGVTHVLSAYVRAWSFNRVLRDQGLAPGWLVAVLDGERRFLARTLSDDPLDPMIGKPIPPETVEELQRGSDFFFSKTPTGERVYTAAASSAQTGWTVILGAPAAPLDRAAQRSIWAVAGGALAALGLAAVFGWTLARSYAKREAAEGRALALEAAAMAEQRSAAILESTTDGVLELDRDWRIAFINGRARDLIAGGRDLRGRILWEEFPEAVGTIFWDRYRHAMERREAVAFEAFYPPLNGWYAVRAFPTAEGLAIYFQDITERRRAELALEEAARQATEILESIGDAFYAIDRDWRFTYVNHRALELFGKTRDDLIGRGFFEVFPQVEGSVVHGTYREVMADHQARDFEAFSPILKRWTSFSVYPHAGPHASGGLSVYFRDVSAQKAAEAALKASELRYRTLVEALPQLVWTCRPDGACDFLSRQWTAYTGRPEAEQLGFGWAGAVHPDDRDRLLARWRHCVETGTVFDIDARLRGADGTYRWFKQRAVPLPGPESEAGRWFGTSTDITDVIEARDAMRAAKEEAEQVGLRFRTLADSIPQLAWMAQPDGRIFWHNKRWYEYTGATPEEMRERGWNGLLHPDHAGRVAARMQRSWDTGDPWEDTFPLKGADGGYRWFLSRALPVRGAHGAVVLWFGTNTDITEHLEIEEALRRAKETAEQAALSKSKFLASASHDLRQPMQSLFLFSGALHAHVQGEQGRAILAQLERGLDALKGLLDSLLDVSRLDAGVVKPTIEDLPVGLLLDHIAAGYAPVARGKGLEWTMAACPFHVRSDRVLLGRMIRNLVENAVRYTERGRIEIGCDVVGDRLRIHVTDTGIGIAADQLPRVFEEFHQVGNQERDRSQGLGLGLSIVQRIGQLLDHPVSVRSEPGKGSAFCIDVPLGKAETGTGAAEPAAVEALPAGKGEERFAVVVDDDAIVLLGLQAILKDWGYEVLIAGSAEQALEKLRAGNRTPDIVIADYRLRDGKIGTDAILAIRNLFGLPIPGIIVTGETGPECQRDAAQHGLGLMHKPVTPRQLGSAVERYMNAAE